MKQIVISDPAKEDLYNIAEYIAEHNPAAAERLMKKFLDKFYLLATFPMLGRARDDIVIGMRCLVMDNY